MRLFQTIAIAISLPAVAAMADEMDSDELPPAALESEIAEPAASSPEPAAFPERVVLPEPAAPPTGLSAIEDWDRQRTWRYDHRRFFSVTQALGEEDIPVAARGALMVVTVPFDVAHLPFAAIAGLFGD